MLINIKECQKIRQNLGRFLDRFSSCIKTKPSRRHLQTYINGQISDLERKSVEPIALEAGVAPRTLQKFLGEHRWDEDKLSSKQRQILMRDHKDDNAIAVIDETSFAKKGNKTVAVQRQYCGSTGKKDNCVVSVHLSYVTDSMRSLADEDIYLPKETWHEDRDRCEEVGIPEEVVYRPKWQIALDILKRSTDEGMKFRFLTADELYGGCAAFRHGVSELNMTYVVEVPCSTYVWRQKPRIILPEPSSGQGRPGKRARLAEGAKASCKVNELWPHGGPSWEAYHIKDTEKGPSVWEARCSRVWVSEGSLPGQEVWLLITRNPLDGEIKYFLSNAPEETRVETMLKVAFTRWTVERLFQDAKGQVGMDHFEVRTYKSLKRHLILSRVSLHFLMREVQKLRGEKSLVQSPSNSTNCGSPDRTGDLAA
jgi:SRSO17 transposase